MTPEINTIVYATGLGSGAPHVFRYALGLAKQYEAEIEIVCGMTSFKQYSHKIAENYLGHKDSKKLHQEARERVKAELERQVEAMCRSAIVDEPDGYKLVKGINVIEDSPDLAILQCAEKVKADILVMGTHRKTTRRGALIGSCAFKVVHESSIPVLLVRIPEGFEDLPHEKDAPSFLTS